MTLPLLLIYVYVRLSYCMLAGVRMCECDISIRNFIIKYSYLHYVTTLTIETLFDLNAVSCKANVTDRRSYFISKCYDIVTKSIFISLI